MGNIGGLMRRGALSIDTVRPVARQVCLDLFPTLIKVVDAEHGVLFEWVHEDDRAAAYQGEAFCWYQYNRSKVGGKPIRWGEFGWWLRGRIEAHTADRLSGVVKHWDEGVGETWLPDLEKHKTPWEYQRGYLSNSTSVWADCALVLAAFSGYKKLPAGLDQKYIDDYPEWVQIASCPAPKQPPMWWKLLTGKLKPKTEVDEVLDIIGED